MIGSAGIANGPWRPAALPSQACSSMPFENHAGHGHRVAARLPVDARRLAGANRRHEVALLFFDRVDLRRLVLACERAVRRTGAAFKCARSSHVKLIDLEPPPQHVLARLRPPTLPAWRSRSTPPHRDVKMFIVRCCWKLTRDAVRLATQPLANVSRAVAMSSCPPSTEMPRACTSFTVELASDSTMSRS